MEYQKLIKKIGRPSFLHFKMGTRFGLLEFIKEIDKKKSEKDRMALCNCDCGKEIRVPLKSLKSGNKKSCGCLKTNYPAHNRKNLIGKRFERLIVENFSHIDKGNRAVWVCLCDCGKRINLNTNQLTDDYSHSCGCLKKEELSKRVTTHGFTSGKATKMMISFIKKWSNLKSRCSNNKIREYPSYGGRGIKCEWNSFEEFRDDMWDSFLTHIKDYGLLQTTLDRINVNDNYSKKNCRWATWEEQFKNKRKNIVNY